MFLPSLTNKINLTLILLITCFSLITFAQNDPENTPQTQPEKPELLFKPMEFLPVFKKFPLPDDKILNDKQFNELITNIYEELKDSWLKNRMYNELFELMRTKKNPVFSTFINDYFDSSSSFEWKVSDFEALTTQLGLVEGRKKIEELLTTKFNYDDELSVRMPILFYYQKTFAEQNKKEVISFLKKLQDQLTKPKNNEVHSYYWISMLRLASGDTNILTEVQNWLFKASFNNDHSLYLDSENFSKIMIQAQAKNLTEKNVDSNSWMFAIDKALDGDILPEINALFARSLQLENFDKLNFDEKLDKINPNLHPYYSIVCLLNGVEESHEKVAETISRLGNLGVLVSMINRNEYNKKYVPTLLKIILSKIGDKNYSTRYGAREGLRKLLLYSDAIDAKTIIEIEKEVSQANIETRELNELKMTLVFLAASIKDEVLFERLFTELNKTMTFQSMLNDIRNQLYRSSQYFNDNLKRIIGKKLINIIPGTMPFSEYAFFDVIKEFVDIEEIADLVLKKIPEWYSLGNERNRKYYFTYTGTEQTLFKLASIEPKKTAQVIIPLYIYLSESDELYDNSKVSLQEVFARCGTYCAGYLQQLYELTHEENYLYLISTLRSEDIAGFVYETLKKSNASDEVKVKVIENLGKIIKKSNVTLFAPFMLQEDQELSVKLVSFIASMKIMVD